MDVDLIMVGKTTLDQPDLKLPHPLAHQRGFVLVPWHEIDPRGEVPGQGPVAELVGGVDTDGVVLRTDLEIESE